MDRKKNTQPSHGKAITFVFVPFMLAYFLSEMFRNVNGVVGPSIQIDLTLDAESLGALTSIFFVSVAASQIFVGVLLDRFGGRRTVAFLLVFAAIGSVLFATGNYVLMYIGRFLIGFGVSGCWTAAFKVNAQWWRPENLAFANGAIIGCAGFGALVATAPTQYILLLFSWQELFLWFSGATVLIAIFLWVFALDHPSDYSNDLSQGTESFIEAFKGFRVVLCNPVFVACVPISVVGQGVWLSYQGLWAGAWLREVNGLSPFEASWVLLMLAICVILGNLVMGAVSGWFSRNGVSIIKFAFFLCVVSIFIQTAIWINFFNFSSYLWGVFGLLVSGSIMFYAILSTALPNEYAGRAVSLLNLFATLAGFIFQYGVGVIINIWEPNNFGVYPVDAHQTALGFILVVQAFAVIWFLWCCKSSVFDRFINQ